MSKINFAGIRRGNKFSPNHTGNDNAIFELTKQHLLSSGCSVKEYNESEFLEQNIPEQFIFNMARDKRAVGKLQQLQNDGNFVINSGFGIENCFRSNMTKLLLDNGVSYPKSFIADTTLDATSIFKKLDSAIYWIKRGDFHAIHKEDVTYVDTIDEGNMILREYALRGIPDAVISEHLLGDLVKFYGVRGTDFFYWFYPFDLMHSKFGLEVINGEPTNIFFNEKELKELGNKAAEVLDVYVYGGDAIVSPDGKLTIIDLNDWPSFAPCRDTAAKYIAQSIYEQASMFQKKHELLTK